MEALLHTKTLHKLGTGDVAETDALQNAMRRHTHGHALAAQGLSTTGSSLGKLAGMPTRDNVDQWHYFFTAWKLVLGKSRSWTPKECIF